MPNFGLGAGQIGSSCVETGVAVGDPRRYRTRNVVRTSRKRIRLVNHNIYVPGRKKRSIADQRVDLLFEKQQQAIAKDGDYAVPRFIQKESMDLSENQLEISVKKQEEKEENHTNKPFFSKNADPEMIKFYYEQEEKEKRRLKFEEEQNELKKKRHIGGIEAMKIEAEASILWGRNKEERLIAKDILDSVKVSEDPNSLTKKYGLLRLKCPEPDFNAVNEMLEYEMMKKIKSNNNNDNNSNEMEIEENDEDDKEKEKEKNQNQNENQKMMNCNLIGKIIINNKIREVPNDEIITQKSLDNSIYQQQLSPPSNVLHLTRLSKTVTVDNLISIYNRFQKDINNPIEYKLFQKGKLRNQAFIKFDSIETAKDALELSRGYILLGKPIVVDFSKK